ETSQLSLPDALPICNRAVNQLKGGFTDYERQDQPAVRWKGADFPYHPVLNGGSVIVMLRGYTIGASPLNILQDTQSLRDDLTISDRKSTRLNSSHVS